MKSYQRFEAKSKDWPTFKEVWGYPAHIISFVFGIGLIRIAPGTWGSLLGVLVYPCIHADMTFVTVATLACFVFGSMASELSIQRLGIHDHSGIIIDEVMGMWLTLLIPQLCFPLEVGGSVLLGLGFLLFRLFDIWKPYPIAFFDRLVKGGVGVMLDDVLAGIYAGVLLTLLKYIGLVGYLESIWSDVM